MLGGAAMNCGFCGGEIRDGYTRCKECGAVLDIRFTGPQAITCFALGITCIFALYAGIGTMFDGTMKGFFAGLLAIPVGIVSGIACRKLFRIFGAPRWYRS